MALPSFKIIFRLTLYKLDLKSATNFIQHLLAYFSCELFVRCSIMNGFGRVG